MSRAYQVSPGVLGHALGDGHGIYRDRAHGGAGHRGTGLHHGYRGFGFPHYAFGLHHGLGVGFRLGFLPYYGPWNGYAYPYYYRDPYGRDPLLNRVDPRPRADTLGGDTLKAFGGRVAVPGPTGRDSLLVEAVTPLRESARPILRLTWQDMGRQAEEVALFLADTTQAILAVQTLRGRPFTALFEVSPEAAFAGMTVVWPSGSKSTRLIALPAVSR